MRQQRKGGTGTMPWSASTWLTSEDGVLYVSQHQLNTFRAKYPAEEIPVFNFQERNSCQKTLMV